jgi:translation initiation factor IF-2
MSPSVPIRIAAPSIRATPPRPPKSHRNATPQERHGQQHNKKEEKSRPAAATIEVPKVITLTDAMTVKELSEKMMVSETEIIKRLFMKGFMRTVNQLVELELAKDLATEMEYEVLTEETAPAEEEVAEKVELTEEEQSALVTRPPVVTIMGHVDHGKTSLLDAIRQTKFLLTAAEAGGITQHIGAYHVEVPGEDGNLRQIVFLDTPGHEAFTAMRARGAKVTDIAILVVAADDGVMPQTIEAIDHAKAAGVPMIVAVNKVDKAEADPDRVLNQLMEHGLLPDRYGGETVTVNVSAKKRSGLDELLEMILLVADMQDLKANPEKPAIGTIVEAELSKGRGAVATALIQNGTLREGDFIVAGSKYGRVRALFDDRGQRIKAAGPSMPVEVLGLDEAPFAGDPFQVVEDAQAQRSLVESRKNVETVRRTQHVSLETLHDLLEQGEVKELNVIVKADVQTRYAN